MPAQKQIKLDCGHEITVAGSLKMKDFRRWIKAEQEQEFLPIYEFLAKLVVAWDWPDLNPRDPASYDELDLPEYKQVAAAASDWLKQGVDAKN